MDKELLAEREEASVVEWLKFRRIIPVGVNDSDNELMFNLWKIAFRHGANWGGVRAVQMAKESLAKRP